MSPDADPTPKQDDEDCSGCGGRCGGATPEECRGPSPLPWLPFDRCMFFYEARVFDLDRNPDRRQLLVRVTYEHCLRLIGRQQGPLLYTTTLLPGETVQLYEFDRYRRVRSEEQRMSVHTSFRQTVSALSQSRRATSASAYFQTLTDVRARTDASVSAGGGLAGFLGGPEVNVDTSVTAETTVASGAATQTVSEQFAQFCDHGVAVDRGRALAGGQQLRGRRAPADNGPDAPQRQRLLRDHVLRAPRQRGLRGHHPRRVHRVAPRPGRLAFARRPRGSRRRRQAARAHRARSAQGRRGGQGPPADHAADRRHPLRGRARALLVVRAGARGGPRDRTRGDAPAGAQDVPGGGAARARARTPARARGGGRGGRPRRGLVAARRVRRRRPGRRRRGAGPRRLTSGPGVRRPGSPARPYRARTGRRRRGW